MRVRGSDMGVGRKNCPLFRHNLFLNAVMINISLTAIIFDDRDKPDMVVQLYEDHLCIVL